MFVRSSFQIEAYCKQQVPSLSIVGYYQVNERLSDSRLVFIRYFDSWELSYAAGPSPASQGILYCRRRSPDSGFCNAKNPDPGWVNLIVCSNSVSIDKHKTFVSFDVVRIFFSPDFTAQCVSERMVAFFPDAVSLMVSR